MFPTRRMIAFKPGSDHTLGQYNSELSQLQRKSLAETLDSADFETIS